MEALNALGAIVVISLSMVVRLTAAQVHLCPCYGQQEASIVAHAGYCFIVILDQLVAWHNASDNNSNADVSCMRHYSLAALLDTHVRLAVAHKLKQEAALSTGARLRVALGSDGANDTTWHWSTGDGRRLSANASSRHFVLWLGEGHQLQSELHTSAVLDLDSGQLATASVHETLTALRTAHVVSPSAAFSCALDASGAAVNGDLDVVTGGTVAMSIECERRCHSDASCMAFSLAPVNGTDSLQCVLHKAYSAESVEVSRNAGGQYCTRGDDDHNRKLCPRLSALGGSAAIDYSAVADGISIYNYEGGTVATVSCDNGTYFYHNRQTQVQVACDGQSGQWLYWDDRQFMCIRLTKIWLLNAPYTPKWQEWQPGALSVGVPQGDAIATMTMQHGSEATAVYHKGFFYFVMPSLGHVYKIEPTTRLVARQQPDIAAGYRRNHAAGAMATGGRLLVCGGHLNTARGTCFVHWLTSGVTQWSTAMLGGARWGHSMVYYRHRIYTVGGYNGAATIWDVQSIDAATLSAWRHEAHMVERRHHANDGVTVFRGRLYVCGGHWNTVGHTDTCEFFDGTAWTLVSGVMPRKLYCGSLNSLDDRYMYYAGGYITGVGDLSYVSVFDAQTQTWSDEPHGLLVDIHRHCAIETW